MGWGFRPAAETNRPAAGATQGHRTPRARRRVRRFGGRGGGQPGRSILWPKAECWSLLAAVVQ